MLFEGQEGPARIVSPCGSKGLLRVAAEQALQNAGRRARAAFSCVEDLQTFARAAVLSIQFEDSQVLRPRSPGKVQLLEQASVVEARPEVQRVQLQSLLKMLHGLAAVLRHCGQTAREQGVVF